MSWAEHYDAVAASYDDFTSSTGWRGNTALVDVLERSSVTAGSILDLGAGTGQTATALRALYPEAELVLAEPSIEMARLAAAIHPGLPLMLVEADDLLGDADPVLGPASYDLIACVGVLELLPDAPRTVALAARNLNAGGHLAVTHELLLEHSSAQGDRVSRLSEGRTVTRHTSAELEAAATAAGLVRIDSTEVVAYQRGDAREDVHYEVVVWRLS